jgi:hypothetical protein
MDLRLSTTGPHSDDYTRRVANGISEAVRVLNYATRLGECGITYPATVGDVLGSLSTATYGTQQLLTQLIDALEDQRSSGDLRATQPHDVHTTVMAAAVAITRAREAATTVAEALRSAQNATAALYLNDPAEGEDR